MMMSYSAEILTPEQVHNLIATGCVLWFIVLFIVLVTLYGGRRV